MPRRSNSRWTSQGTSQARLDNMPGYPCSRLISCTIVLLMEEIFMTWRTQARNSGTEMGPRVITRMRAKVRRLRSS